MRKALSSSPSTIKKKKNHISLGAMEKKRDPGMWGTSVIPTQEVETGES
jgi:hypothetical protein